MIEEGLAPRTVAFAMQSNLWLLDDRLAAVLAAHNVPVGTSLDGPPALNDAAARYRLLRADAGRDGGRGPPRCQGQRDLHLHGRARSGSGTPSSGSSWRTAT